MKKAAHWILSTVVAMCGGGIAASLPAITDPTKYHFPQDIGSGKLVPYVITGAVLTLVGILIHSPLGQTVTDSLKQSQQQLAATQQELAQAKKKIQREPPLYDPNASAHSKPDDRQKG